MTKRKTAKLIDGKMVADKILRDLAKKIPTMKQRPGLAAILIGNDPASKLYIKNKDKAAKTVGIDFHSYQCNKDFYSHITEEQILEMIHFLNRDGMIDGIIVQLPLPKEYNTQKIINAIDPKKDVDGFSADGGQYPAYTPPLIRAIMKIIAEYKIPTKGKEAVIVAKSDIFSKKMERALKEKGAKVQRVKVGGATQKADILISIVGKPGLIKENMIKEGAAVIDVGITLVNGKFKGDVDLASVKKKASLVTPTPGGVGPVTVACLLEGVYELAQKKL